MNELTRNGIWRKAFWTLSLLSLLIMPWLSRDFGQNGDENVEIQYGIDIYNYYAHGDPQALDYDEHPSPVFPTHMSGMQFYGGMFDLITEAVHQQFPAWHIVDVRHFFTAVFGALLLLFTGLLAYRLSGKNWCVAVLSFLFLLFAPRIFGESMNNGKDIPFATSVVMGIYYLVRLLQDLPLRKNLWKETLLLALSWGIAFGVRSAGGLIFVGYVGLFTVLYFLLNKAHRHSLFADKNKLFRRLAVYLVSAFLLGFVLGLLSWPYALQAPVTNVLAALKEMTNRSVELRVLFEGKYRSNMRMPWYYEFKWICITNPIIVLLFTLLFIPLIGKARQRYGSFVILLLLFAALFPILYIIYKNSSVYDTWRHVFFVYPFWVIMAALSVDMLQTMLKGKLRFIPLGLAFLGLLPAMVWTVQAHPHQYVYFNAFVGGPKGAFGQYDLDYYLVSGKASAEWVMKNVPRPPAGQKVKVLSNMEGMDTYFRNDTSWIYTTYARYYERGQHDWDYYITYGRFVDAWQLQNGKWPPANVVHTIEAGGVPIGVVIQRKSDAGYKAYQAMQEKDFAAACDLYAAYVQTDSSDEMVWINYAIALASTGRLPESVQAMQSAIALNPTAPQPYQVLAQIYQAMGDGEKAQQAQMQAQSIMAQQQMDQM